MRVVGFLFLLSWGVCLGSILGEHGITCVCGVREKSGVVDFLDELIDNSVSGVMGQGKK
jgi:hypothetical protein